MIDQQTSNVERLQRKDPVDRYYRAAANADNCSNILFWIAAVLSIAVLFVESDAHPLLFQATQIAFAIVVIAVFIIGMTSRLYWTPRAEDQRRLGFFSNSFDTALTHEKTEGFYNNLETEPLKRLGLSLMENCFFTRGITLEMLRWERIIVALYLAVFLGAIMLRNTDLAIIPIAAQAVFSEQIISRWLRLEWLSFRCGSVYSRLFDLFQAPPQTRVRNARILDALASYETSKANAGIALSSRVFQKLNPQLSKEWDDILASLKKSLLRVQP